jgi:hypothetical protein
MLLDVKGLTLLGCYGFDLIFLGPKKIRSKEK